MRAAELLAGVDYRENIHRRERPTEDDLAQAIRASQESGELRHLYGKPLDLSEDTSDWLMRRIVRDAGFTHPVLERGRDLEAGRHAAEQIVEELRRRRDWLASPEARRTPAQAYRFNEKRRDALAEYRKRLAELDRAILSHNLTVPTPLQRRQLKIDELVRAAEEAVPPFDLRAEPPCDAPPSQGIWKRLCAGIWPRRRTS